MSSKTIEFYKKIGIITPFNHFKITQRKKKMSEDSDIEILCEINDVVCLGEYKRKDGCVFT